MEIQYQNINKLSERYLKLAEILTPDLCALINLDTDEAKSEKFDASARELLYGIDDTLKSIFPEDLFDFEIYDEIELNVVNIETEQQLKRYLKHIRSKVNTVFELLTSLTDFNNYPLKYWGDIIEEGIKNKDFYHPGLFKVGNPATNLKVSYLRLIEQVAVLRDQIDSKLNDGKDFTTISPLILKPQPDEGRVWRLIIEDPKRRLYFDKWTTKMREVRKRIHENEKLINEINKPGYNPDAGSRLHKDFLEWSNHITHDTLPDQVFSYEIMNEIDINLLELKTDREKDLYLSKISGELWAAAGMFKGLIKSHPSYVEGEPDSLGDWRKLSATQHQAGPLEMMYIHLLVLEEVINKIVAYANGLIKPDKPIITEESLILDNELKAANHRLLLLHKLNLFVPLYQQHFNHIGIGSFTKLIASIIGVPKESLDGFRAEVRKLISEIDNPSIKKTVQTPSANSKVNQTIAEIGLINTD